jgi:ATP-binding cassette, subfamily C, bacterial LapB
MTASTTPNYDPLLECLVLFAKRYYRPVSTATLITGLPVEPGAAGPEMFSIHSSKGMFSRVAKRAGFASRLIQRDLDSLSELLLPCILVLKDRNACILETIDRASGKAKIILPEVGDGEEWIDLATLREQHLGFAFLLKREYRHQDRALQLVKNDGSHWLWGTLWRSRDIYTSVILGSLLVNLFVLAMPLFTMNVYDRVVPNNAVDTLWVLAIGVAIAYLLDTVLRFTRTWLLETAGKKSDVIISSILFEQTMALRMDQWPKTVGAFANNLREFESIRNFITSSTLLALIDLPFALLFLVVIAFIGGPLVVVPLITITLLLIYSFLLVKPLRNSVESTYAAAANKHALLVENLHSIHTIKTLGASHHSQWEWEEATGEIANKSLRSRLLSGSIVVVTNLLVQITTVGIVIAGVYLLRDLQLSLGGLIATVILASRAVAPMGQMAVLITSYQQTRTAYNNLNELMSLAVERPEGKVFVRPPRFQGNIALDQLGFTYPESERASLTDICVKIQPGEHVGIIGKVGSGKTTITKLLVGLYAPSQGAIAIDGIDINQIDPADLRSHIAYLSQDVELFRGTLRENVLFKAPRIHDDALLQAAHAGGVDLFVNRLPMGYDTPVGEQGVGLSGGQRQCVALARALLLDCPIIILDEPTNSMDNTTEAEIRKRLLEYTRGKTLILVTHKAPMLDLVDRLIVMDEGRVVLDGPKEQVLKTLRGGQDAA